MAQAPTFGQPFAPPAAPAVPGTVGLAKSFLGTPYVWGGESPNGFDCSGLLQYVFAKSGVKIPRVTYDQFKVGAPVDRGSLAPGDAVFFTGSDPKSGLPGHVGLYVGNGKYIQAPHTGANVQISDLSGRSDFVGGRRYAGGGLEQSAVSTAATTLGAPAVDPILQQVTKARKPAAANPVVDQLGRAPKPNAGKARSQQTLKLAMQLLGFKA